MSDEKRRCDNCMFHHKSNSIGNHQCRRHPPVLVPNTDSLHAYWPDVKPYNWCGEFQLIQTVADGCLNKGPQK